MIGLRWGKNSSKDNICDIYSGRPLIFNHSTDAKRMVPIV